MTAFSPFSSLSRSHTNVRLVLARSLARMIIVCAPVPLYHHAYAAKAPLAIFSISTGEKGMAAIPSQNAPSLSHAGMIRNVLASALTFMTPRILTPHSVEELCLWGLNGLTALDSSIALTQQTLPPPPDPSAPQPETHAQTEATGRKLSLLHNGEILLNRPMPEKNDLKMWVDLSMTMIQAAWTHSETLRSAGEEALLSGFFDELFNHLDPYSRYLTPHDAHDERDHRQGVSYSIGLTLSSQEDAPPVISAINVNSPAWNHGINIGQSLLGINGRSTLHVPLHTVLQWLYGAPNSLVTLTLGLPSGKVYTCSLRRNALPPETVFPEHIGRYTALKITRFSTQTAEEVSQYLSSAMLPPNTDPFNDTPTNKLPGIILDLRGNRGGVLQQAIITAALLLDNGIAATTEGRNPAANHIWAVQGGDITNGSPVVVLVDGQTASAAEVLAAALADRQRAVVIGSNTLGKGLVQIIGQMPNGGEIFVTWSRNLAPLGWPIQGLGVMPQLCTSQGNTSVKTQLRALHQGHSLQKDILHQSRMVRNPVSIDQLLHIRQHCPAATGNELDISAALHLLASPKAYQTLLHSIPDDTSTRSVTLH